MTVTINGDCETAFVELATKQIKNRVVSRDYEKRKIFGRIVC